jgi:hypothetical protein
MRPAMQHIRVKAGFVNSTNGFAVIKMPAKEVFGEDVILDSDELYFNATEWEKSKIFKAVQIVRDGLIFTGKDKKGLTISMIKAKTADIGFRYPEVDAVLPSTESSLVAIDQIGLNPFVLLDACKVFGEVDKQKFVLSFRGADKGIMISHIESEAICMVMPCLITNTEI